MKTERGRLDGQIDIFEAMNRAAAAVDKMMEEDRQHKKKEPVKKKEQETLAKEEKRGTQEHIIRGCDMHASMQTSFLNPSDGDFATVAYIDYRMVYYREWNTPAALRVFEESKDAVEFYMRELDRLREISEAEQTKEHEPFLDMKYVMENKYIEC